MLNKDKLKSQSTELQDLYKQLDSIIEGDKYILKILDSESNSYAYSDRLRLFDALEMIINGYSSFSNMDLVNRIIHFISIQHQLFCSFIQKKEVPVLIKEKAVNIIDNIITLMLEIITTLVSSVNIEELATYIVNLINKLKR